MSRPTEVLVNVKDLEIIRARFHSRNTALHGADPGYYEWAEATSRLIAAIPEPEWEPTVEQVVALRKALDTVQPGWYTRGGGAKQILQHLHEQGFDIE